MPDVVINFATAGEANVARAQAAQNAAIRAQSQALGEAYNAAMRSESALSGMTAAGAKGMRVVGGEVKNLVLGIIGGGGIIGAFSMWKQANADILKQAHDTTLAYDALFRKFNIQSGLRGLAGSEAKEKLLDVASQRAVPEEVAAQAATQLVSSGYAVTDVIQGGATSEFLQGMNAMNQRGAGVNTTGLAGAATSYMTAMGVNKDAEGMRETMSSLYSAFQGTNIQLPDLQQYAAKAGGMRGKLSFRELIAAGSIHRDLGIGSAESASGIEGLVSQAGTAGSSNDKIETLGSMGLTPEDIDFIGENLDTVLNRLQTGLQSLPEVDRESAMKKIFEQSGVKFLKPLLEGRGTISERVTAMENAEEGYAGAVKESEQGPTATKNRQDVARNRRREKQDMNQVAVLNELVALAEEKGESPARTMLAKQAYEASLNTTGDLDTAGRAFTNVSGLEFSDYSTAKKRLAEKGLDFGTFGDTKEPAAPKVEGDADDNAARLARLKAQRAAKRSTAEANETPGLAERFGFGGATERIQRESAALAEVRKLDKLIAALEANTAATQANSTANGATVETPPAPPPSVGLGQ